MNNCKYLTIRKKNYKPYFFCRLDKTKIEKQDCYKCEDKIYKEKTPTNHKVKDRTKATKIPIDVKEKVWERDKGECILCGKSVPIECACCHFIPRSQGGLGIEENIFTACNDCHREQDNGKNSLELEARVEQYLQAYYGKNWNKQKLIYKKGIDYE